MSDDAAPVPFRFTDARSLRFVELYRDEACLWNRKKASQKARNKSYKNIMHTMNALTTPGELPLTLERVKMKIKNFRTHYHQELKKIKLHPGYHPKVIWFDLIHTFLECYLQDSKLLLPRPNRSRKRDSMRPTAMKRLKVKLTRFKTTKRMPLEPDLAELPKLFDTDETTGKIKQETAALLEVTPNVEHMDLTPRVNLLSTPPPLVQIVPPAPPRAIQISEVTSLAQPSAAKPDSAPKQTLPPGEDEFHFFGLSIAAQLRSMPFANAMIMQSKMQHLLSVERRQLVAHAIP